MKQSVPSSNKFCLLSLGFRDGGDAALSLIRSDGYSGFAVFPCVFSYFRCIELALKAVLAHHAVPKREIAQTLGHRLSLLISRAEAFTTLPELGMSPEERKLLDRFSKDYADKWFEYPDDFWTARPKLEELKALAHRICDKIRIYER
ncbi:MAG: hypothetical protein NTV08_07745 [Verrucomicrobia bacterium]|nr:hypothetical protein [Verrucomicrobiota bacterium]